MELLILSSAPLIPFQEDWKAYGPYVKEMELWSKNSSTIVFSCPVWSSDKGLLVSDVPFEIKKVNALIEFQITSLPSIIRAFYAISINLFKIFRAMKKADHIHLRCPGNIGFLGCFVQIFFPNKPKTVKYAGNWDPNAKQPFSYKLQKWILSNTFLTKNMQVLVYGEWPNQSKNIKPFFTATYSELDKRSITEKKIEGLIRLLFVGTLSGGKQPLYAVQLAQKLIDKGYQVQLQLFGEGEERQKIEKYIKQYNLESVAVLEGNHNKEKIQQAYEDSHFLILPSKSEGWPKVVAEAMFWGCVPVSTKVSCVPTMLDGEKSGLLLEMNLDTDSNKISALINNVAEYQNKRNNAVNWSRKFTLEYFEIEIQKLLKA